MHTFFMIKMEHAKNAKNYVRVIIMLINGYVLQW